MKLLLITLSFIFMGINFIPMKKVLSIVPYYYFPSTKNLRQEGIEIAKSAYQLLIYGQIEESLELAKLAISLNDTDENIWAILAESQIANELYEDALFSLKQAKEINPYMSEFYFAESSIYLYQNNLDEAKTTLTKGLEIEPDNYNGIFQLGNIFLMEKNYKKALIQFEKAIMINPEFWQAINNRGLVFFELDKNLLAISSFEEAISIEENAETLLALAVSLKTNKRSDAILLAQKALKLDPKYVSSEYREEQLWGGKLQKATDELFLFKELEEDILFAKEYLN